MISQTIVETEMLNNHLNDPEWVIMDCRFDLNDTEWGWDEYQELHIPGAIYAHLDKDLAGPITSSTGRHPLPDISVFSRKLSDWGITLYKQIVAYDTVGGAFAARLWWLLRYFGYFNVAILNGGLGKWIREGLPLESGIEKGKNLNHAPEIHPNQNLMVTTSEMVKYYLDSSLKIIDARSRERYLGENEPIDPIAGRIPGVLNRFHGENLQPDLTIKPAETLREEFSKLLGSTPGKNTIVYCGSGVTSCHHLLAMQIAGIEGVRLYLGSWSEWIRDPSHPIERG